MGRGQDGGKALRSRFTRLPTDQQVLDSIPGSAIEFMFRGELFHGIVRLPSGHGLFGDGRAGRGQLKVLCLGWETFLEGG